MAKAERRLIQQGKAGILFTNGTGTGKTFTGLGIIKRSIRRGKGRILIVVPSQTKVEDWTNDGKLVQVKITPLKSVQETGEGVVVTTYANFYQNQGLRFTDWDMVVYDESHKLLSNEKGADTKFMEAHFDATNHSLAVHQKAIKKVVGDRPVITDDRVRADEVLRDTGLN